MSGRWQVILLPGGVLPAEPAYRSLLTELGDDVHARLKDLEVYAGDEPPPAYSLDTESDGIERVANEVGFDRFHLVGYSGGGASSLAFTLRHPERLRSLALLEPAFAGWQRMTHDERAHFEEFKAIAALPADRMLPAFQRAQLAPGVELVAPPPGPPPPWMTKRPAGLRAMIGAFLASRPGPRRPGQIRPTCPVRAGWPEPPRLLRAHGRAAPVRVPGLHRRDLPRATPFRPTASHRTGAHGGVPARALGAGGAGHRLTRAAGASAGRASALARWRRS